MSKKIYVGDGLYFWTDDRLYNNYTDKPKINNVTVNGNIALENIGLYSKEEIDEKIEQSKQNDKHILNVLPATGIPHDVYYVYNEDANDYSIYYWDDENGEFVYVGQTTMSLDTSLYQTKEDDGLDTDSKVVVTAINNLHNDLEEKLGVTDIGLATTNKNVVLAINEVNTKLKDTTVGIKDVIENFSLQTSSALAAKTLYFVY